MPDICPAREGIQFQFCPSCRTGLSNEGTMKVPVTGPGTNDTDNNRFQIVGNQLRSTEIFDYETTSSLAIRIGTTDQGGG